MYAMGCAFQMLAFSGVCLVWSAGAIDTVPLGGLVSNMCLGLQRMGLILCLSRCLGFVLRGITTNFSLSQGQLPGLLSGQLG